MESVELQQLMRDLFIIISNAKNAVDESPAVRCSRKLQGALVKLDEMAEELRKDGRLPEKSFVVDESPGSEE